MSSFYKREMVMDKGLHVKSRISYIDSIAKGLRYTPQLFPRPDQERLYQKALAHVVQVLSAETHTLSVSGTVSRGNEDGCCNKNAHAQIMRNMLKKLQCMERERLYDPPSDYEIGYYLLVKKYSRPIFTFLESQYLASNLCRVHEFDWNPYRRGLSCFSPFSALHFVEELGEVNSHMEHISANLSKMDSQNGQMVKPLLGINTMEKDETPPVVCGSKQRSNMFYYHKFMLALMDLRSSLHAFSTPLPEEKNCFQQVLFHIGPRYAHPVEDEVDVYSHNLRDKFVVRLMGDTDRLGDDCFRIAQEILKKASIHISQEKLHDIFLENDDNAKEQDRIIVNCYKEMVEKCNISCNDLPDYIGNMSQAIEILVYILHLNGNLLTLSDAVDKLFESYSSDIFDYDDSWYSESELKNIGWEALHALTLFKHGGSIPVMEFAKKNTLQNCFNKGKKETEVEKDTNENVEIMKGILEDFRRVGEWDLQTPPTYDECQVARQIWHCLVCPIHFFNCTMAYEQKIGRIKIGQNNAAKRKAKKRKRGVYWPLGGTFYSFSWSLRRFNRRISVFIYILQGFKDGLLEKLKKLQK